MGTKMFLEYQESYTKEAVSPNNSASILLSFLTYHQEFGYTQ